MSAHRRISAEDIKNWSKVPGDIRKNVRNNDTLFLPQEELSNITGILDEEQVPYKLQGEHYFLLRIFPTENSHLNTKEAREDFVENLISGVQNRIRQFKDGHLFKDNPTSLLDDIEYGFNTQYMRELKHQLAGIDKDLLEQLETSIQNLKATIPKRNRDMLS